MIKALLLLLDPVRSWERVARARRSLLFILLVSVLPLLVLSCVAEAYGLATWGKWQGEIGEIVRLHKFTQQQIIAYEALQFLTSLFLVFMGAKLIKSLGETFHGRHTYAAAFTVTAYALSPLFLLRALDALPALSPWITWAVGIVLSLSVLYQGVPRVMQPDPPHAFGLYLTSAFLLVLISGLIRFVTAWWLEGKFGKVEALFIDLVVRLTGS